MGDDKQKAKCRDCMNYGGIYLWCEIPGVTLHQDRTLTPIHAYEYRAVNHPGMIAYCKYFNKLKRFTGR